METLTACFRLPVEVFELVFAADVDPLEELPVDPEELNRRFVLAYTGAPRNSGINNWEVTKAYINGDRRVQRNFGHIAAVASSMRLAVEKADWMEAGRLLRIGGLVETGSFKREADGKTIDFSVTDGRKSVPVIYSGDIPDLFREGQGVVVEGRLQANGDFRASNVLAKHDERYMPPEVVDALKRAGRWQEGTATPAPAMPPVKTPPGGAADEPTK